MSRNLQCQRKHKNSEVKSKKWKRKFKNAQKCFKKVATREMNRTKKILKKLQFNKNSKCQKMKQKTLKVNRENLKKAQVV